MTTSTSTSFRDFADKSYLNAQASTVDHDSVSQKIAGAISLILMFAAVGGMLLLGSIPPHVG